MSDPRLIDAELFNILRGHLSFQSLREIVLAAHGRKVARLSLPEDAIPIITQQLEKAGLYVGLHDRKLLLNEDHGKGGWVSGYGIEVPLETPAGGYILLYAGKNPSEVLAAQKAEHSYQFSSFGKLLGYPACCIEFYETKLPIVEQEQGDFFLALLDASLENCQDNFPLFPAWTNIGAQYFGYGLTSFYPCNFFCAEAAREARDAFDLVGLYDQELAKKALSAANEALLYTEYEGIYAFPGATLEERALHYDNTALKASLHGVLAHLLEQGDSIRIHSAHSIDIFNGKNLLASLNSPKLGMLLFK